jgi:DNA-binding Xre family transcriptional regulator
MAIRLRVKELAESRGFNQSSLSRASDVSFLTIKRIFREPYKDVALSTLEKLAKALGVHVADLFEEVPDETHN